MSAIPEGNRRALEGHVDALVVRRLLELAQALARSRQPFAEGQARLFLARVVAAPPTDRDRVIEEARRYLAEKAQE
ncbi:MAG: hypothetical protein PW734_04395 [Verrucomicrobium sp.]|nr:hypothetical protein [Verrucomicrobium sp.]